MTTTEEREAIEVRLARSGIGWVELEKAIRTCDVDRAAELLGIKGLSLLVAMVIEKHYPADIFPVDGVQYGVNWAYDEGGNGPQPGVKWIALMRMALEEVAGAE